ncbi:hypothetical protein DSCO28_68220 [Desulfosarcina ovata subsp. sediminis]|uniref:Uncharacterized protein n=1 Tax=Desulfosarcina ovata subsp. sediminis TaxID=885957 RepID=A0A5K8A1F2_9BACT|nr:hypothetical protein DSCO28_68220 [Desulfosarcina ovata subsp. sediminis]
MPVCNGSDTGFELGPARKGADVLQVFHRVKTGRTAFMKESKCSSVHEEFQDFKTHLNFEPKAVSSHNVQSRQG